MRKVERAQAPFVAMPPVYDWRTLREHWGSALDFPRVHFDIMRHGQTVFNRDGLVSGSADVGLTPLGRLQAAALAIHLKPPYEHIYVSALQRSIETLEMALAARHLSLPFIIDARLNERSLGVLEGRRRVYIPEFAAGELDYAPPEGESYRSVTQRCLSFLLDLATTAREWPHGQHVLICTHMGPMRILIGTLCRERDASRMLAAEWANAVAIRQEVSSIPWPAFLGSWVRV